jgi:hypothetical protein
METTVDKVYKNPIGQVYQIKVDMLMMAMAFDILFGRSWLWDAFIIVLSLSMGFLYWTSATVLNHHLGDKVFKILLENEDEEKRTGQSD